MSIRGKGEQRGGGQVGERKEMEGRRNASRTKGVSDGERERSEGGREDRERKEKGETESEKEDKETKNGLLGSNLLDKEAHHEATNESFPGQPERQPGTTTRSLANISHSRHITDDYNLTKIKQTRKDGNSLSVQYPDSFFFFCLLKR